MSGRSGRRVVVTGYGMVTPLAGTANETFARAASGASGIAEIRRFPTDGLPCRIGGEVDDAWIEPSSDPNASRCARLMLTAAAEAVRTAQLDTAPARDRIGVAIGANGQNPELEQVVRLHRWVDDRLEWDREAFSRAGGLDLRQLFRRRPDTVTSMVAARFGLGGPALSLVSACAAGAQAIGEGYRLIRAGRCDAVLAGGADATLDPVGFIGFVLLRVLAERYETAARASRPFDRRRAGFVLSEGSGAVVLEAREHALARGAPVLGELVGYGDSTDAYRITDPRPDGVGAALAMRVALADAAIAPREVEAISAHATSTPTGDLAEARAIGDVFGDHTEALPVSAVKSMLGHTIGAAGAIELILLLIGMRRSVLLPTINQESPDPRCGLDTVPNVARQLEHRLAISSSFGFGGQNACLVVRAGDG
jgi:3-oxoacyl-[acyl-carrier-protein] synthase II